MDSQLLWGTVELILLEVLARGPSYGYAITQEVLSRSGGAFELKEGSLYPALHRLERQKLLKSYWEETAEGRRRKFYKITGAGEKSLREKRSAWEHFHRALQGILGEGHAGLA